MDYKRSVLELQGGIVVEHYVPSQVKKPNPMLFVHGNFHGSWCWRNLLTYFANRGVPCYAVNFRGHWLSDGHAKLGEAITEDYVRDTEECLKAIRAEAILVGHSMGGIVCQKVAEKRRVKSLVLLDSAPCKAITEAYFQSRPEMNQVLEDLCKPDPDGTVVMKRDKEKIRTLLFEKDNVADEALTQAVAYLGRESALVLKDHAFITVDPKKIDCPVYVLARKGLGNDKNPDLWHALADYYDAADRFISGDLSHNMFMENNWEKHAARIEKWCFET